MKKYIVGGTCLAAWIAVFGFAGGVENGTINPLTGFALIAGCLSYISLVMYANKMFLV